MSFFPRRGESVHVDRPGEGPVGLGVGEEGVGLHPAERLPDPVEGGARDAHRALGGGAVEAEAQAPRHPPGRADEAARPAGAFEREGVEIARLPGDERLAAERVGGDLEGGGELAGDHGGPVAEDLGPDGAVRRVVGRPAEAHPVALRAHRQRDLAVLRVEAEIAALVGAERAEPPALRDALAERAEELVHRHLLRGAGRAVDLDLPGPLPGVVRRAAEDAGPLAAALHDELGHVVAAEGGEQVLPAREGLARGHRAALQVGGRAHAGDEGEEHQGRRVAAEGLPHAFPRAASPRFSPRRRR